MADILGDWREELITVVPGELHLYHNNSGRGSSRNPDADDLYRMYAAMVSMGYLYPPAEVTI